MQPEGASACAFWLFDEYAGEHENQGFRCQRVIGMKESNLESSSVENQGVNYG